jgi:hypothetical protein
MDKIIEAVLKKYPKAKRIAVMNFVCTAPDDPMANSYNLNMDAGLYKWNGDTRNAIREALRQLNKI